MQLIDAVKRFGEFVRSVTIATNAAKWEPTSAEYMFSREDLTVLLSGSDAQSYQRCLRDLYDAVAPKQILSRSAVDNLANTAFGHIAKKAMTIPKESSEFQSFCDQELKELRRALERKPYTWEVIERACGIDQANLPMRVGRVTFVLATPAVLDEIPDAQITKGVTREHFAGKVLARVPVLAVDVDAARAAATRVLQQTIDCINFFAAVAGVSGQAYIPGDKESGFGLAVSLGGPDSHVIHHSFIYGPLQPLPLVRLVEQPGFERISKMLESDSLSTLQERILRAFQWAGRAQVDSRREESFLLMAIALESLLLRGQRDENIGYKIALRCAHLIGIPDVASRRSLVRDVKDLYNRRSAIVHSGRVEVSDTELALLRHYLRAALYVVINRKPFSTMADEEELEKWFEERLLEVANNATPDGT